MRYTIVVDLRDYNADSHLIKSHRESSSLFRSPSHPCTRWCFDKCSDEKHIMISAWWLFRKRQTQQ